MKFHHTNSSFGQIHEQGHDTGLISFLPRSTSHADLPFIHFSLICLKISVWLNTSQKYKSGKKETKNKGMNNKHLIDLTSYQDWACGNHTKCGQCPHLVRFVTRVAWSLPLVKPSIYHIWVVAAFIRAAWRSTFNSSINHDCNGSLSFPSRSQPSLVLYHLICSTMCSWFNQFFWS